METKFKACFRPKQNKNTLSRFTFLKYMYCIVEDWCYILFEAWIKFHSKHTHYYAAYSLLVRTDIVYDTDKWVEVDMYTYQSVEYIR